MLQMCNEFREKMRPHQKGKEDNWRKKKETTRNEKFGFWLEYHRSNEFGFIKDVAWLAKSGNALKFEKKLTKVKRGHSRKLS